MSQWEVAAVIYEKLCGLVIKNNDDGCSVRIRVDDVCQIMSDKSGQRLVINELLYEQPAVFEMCLAIEFSGSDTGKILRRYGETAVLLKDNPSITIEEAYRWHGMSGSSVYLEPVIRKSTPVEEPRSAAGDSVVLMYRAEFSLNSQKPEEFKRVEKQVIRGFLK